MVFAGRGIKSAAQDDQILQSLASGTLTMPLWGFSLREDIASSYGTRFLFRLDGPFHGLAAWPITTEQEDQAEVIASGVYEADFEDLHDSTVVTLREVELVRVSTALMSMLETVILGGIYRTTTLVPLERGLLSGGEAAPPDLRVRVVEIGPYGPMVEALEDRWIEAGTVFFCPSANLRAAEEPDAPS